MDSSLDSAHTQSLEHSSALPYDTDSLPYDADSVPYATHGNMPYASPSAKHATHANTMGNTMAFGGGKYGGDDGGGVCEFGRAGGVEFLSRGGSRRLRVTSPPTLPDSFTEPRSFLSDAVTA